MRSSGSENRAGVWKRLPSPSQHPHQVLCEKTRRWFSQAFWHYPIPPLLVSPGPGWSGGGQPYLRHPVKSLFPGYQAGEVEALEDVESTDEGRACVWGSGTENQVAWKDRKLPTAGERSKHLHIPPSHRLKPLHWTPSSGRKTTLGGKGTHPSSHGKSRAGPGLQPRTLVFSFLIHMRKLRLKKTVICPESHCSPLAEQGQVSRCPVSWSTMCLLSAPPLGQDIIQGSCWSHPWNFLETANFSFYLRPLLLDVWTSKEQ